MKQLSLLLLCSSSSVLCTFSCFSCSILHGAGDAGEWLDRWWCWSWCQGNNTSSWRVWCPAIASLKGKCEKSNVLLLETAERVSGGAITGKYGNHELLFSFRVFLPCTCMTWSRRSYKFFPIQISEIIVLEQ